jgi:hypothetical protein
MKAKEKKKEWNKACQKIFLRQELFFISKILEKL